MLALELGIAGDRYALDAREVIEVVPYVGLRVVPSAPEGFAGLLSYRGAVIPVVDLCRLLSPSACPRLMSSRIAVCQIDDTRRVGVLAERVTRLIRVDPDDEAAVPGPATPDRPALGRVVPSRGGLVQLVRVGELVSDALYDELTRGNGEEATA